MTDAVIVSSSMSQDVVRFLRTPKGLLTIVLVILMAIAATGSGIAIVAPGVAKRNQALVALLARPAIG